MDRTTIRHAGRALLLGLAIVAGTSTLAATVPTLGTGVRVAEATAALSDDKNKSEKDRPKGRNEGSDGDEDHVLNGQVLEINTLKEPPELVLGSVDGLTVVRVLKTDEIAINGVRLGDYIQANGEKQHEGLFEATELSVSERYKGESSDKDDDKDDDDKKKKKKK